MLKPSHFMAGRVCMLGLSLFLASCGFTPMYGDKSRAALEGGVQVEAPRDAAGLEFKHHLEDHLNPQGVPLKPRYRLEVEATYQPSAIGVARDGTVSRFNVIIDSTYTFTRLSDGKIIDRGAVKHVSSFNNPANQYFSTYVSEKDAIRRGLAELSELYRQRISTLLLKGADS